MENFYFPQYIDLNEILVELSERYKVA